jgi:hypothetical protein
MDLEDPVAEVPMTASLEVPFRPGWPAPRETRIEPPQVPIEPRWEYSVVVREASAGPLSEAELNQLGADHWELVGLAPAEGRIHFYFKRERRI